MNKKSLIFIFGIIISLVCTWLFARHIDWGTLISALKEADFIYIIPSFFVAMAVYAIRALRWQSILSPLKKIPYINVFSAISIGFMANHILPARAGELIRPIMIAKKNNIKITAVLTTVVLERIFDLIGLIAFTVVVLLIIPAPNENKQINTVAEYSTTATEQEINRTESKQENNGSSFLLTLKRWVGVFAGTGIGAIVFLALFMIFPGKISRFLNNLFSIFPDKIRIKLMSLVDSFIEGLQILSSRKQVIWILFLTILIWVVSAASMYIFSFSFGINLPFIGSCLTLICIAFAVALPQAPGYIGVFHLATQKSLEVFNIELVSSQSFAISLWALSMIPITIIGILFLWKEGIAFKDLAKFEDKNK